MTGFPRRALIEDASPGPVSFALTDVHDRLTQDLCLPLTRCSQAARAAVDAAPDHAGLA